MFMRRQMAVYQRERAVALIWIGMMAVEVVKWRVYPLRRVCWARGVRAVGSGGSGEWGGGMVIAVTGEEIWVRRRKKKRMRLRKARGWCIVLTRSGVIIKIFGASEWWPQSDVVDLKSSLHTKREGCELAYRISRLT